MGTAWGSRGGHPLVGCERGHMGETPHGTYSGDEVVRVAVPPGVNWWQRWWRAGAGGQLFCGKPTVWHCVPASAASLHRL